MDAVERHQKVFPRGDMGKGVESHNLKSMQLREEGGSLNSSYSLGCGCSRPPVLPGSFRFQVRPVSFLEALFWQFSPELIGGQVNCCAFILFIWSAGVCPRSL